MITVDPYTLDDVIYPRMPARHRWIFNKLELAIRLNILAGPCGTRAPRGELCVRPIMNMQGMGMGGFFRVTHEGGLTQNRPGYFWTPWLEGEQGFIYYVKDKCWYNNVCELDDDGRATIEEIDPKLAPSLPRKLRGISRYMMLQTIGGVVIEVSPRHSEPTPRVLADYQKIKSNYLPLNYDTGVRGVPENFTIQGCVLERVKDDPYGMVGWIWNDDETARVPCAEKWG